jgi:hypothetical protein
MIKKTRMKMLLPVILLALFAGAFAGTTQAENVGRLWEWLSGTSPTRLCLSCRGGNWSRTIHWWGNTNGGGWSAKNSLAALARSLPSGPSRLNHEERKNGSWPAHCDEPQTISPNLFVGGGYRPGYPVVAGQDTPGRGADLWIGALVTEAVNSYEVREQDYDCKYTGNPNQSCDGQTGYKKTNIRYDCNAYCQYYPDYITSLDADYALDGGSVDWINGPLRKRYPGARVKGGPYPTLFQWQNEDGDQKAATVKWLEGVQFLDPGKYWVAISAHTHGTRISPPMSRKIVKPLWVYLRDQTIVH